MLTSLLGYIYVHVTGAVQKIRLVINQRSRWKGTFVLPSTLIIFYKRHCKISTSLASLKFLIFTGRSAEAGLELTL